MMVSGASIVVCTYNRSDLLRQTLAALSRMTAPPDCAVEVIVVDNNSTDGTAAVVSEFANAARFPMVRLTERQQGERFALNRALSYASGDVLALTHDDALPSRDWLERIVGTFREREVTFVFGKVLPRWGRLPPPELLLPQSRAIWGPLGIVDCGEMPLECPAWSMTRGSIGANLGLSRTAALAVGGWQTGNGSRKHLPTSIEHQELLMRLRQFDLYAGFYDPELTVRHFVPGQKLTRRYFRRWFYFQGKTQARLLDQLDHDGDITNSPCDGTPWTTCGRALGQCRRWFASLTRGDALSTLTEELLLIECAGLLAEQFRLWPHRRRGRSLQAAGDVAVRDRSAGAH